MKKRLTPSELHKIDSLAVEHLGISSIVLMENAGRGVVEFISREQIIRMGMEIAIVCGKGNNGGDGFVIARHLKIRQFHPVVILTDEPDNLAGDAKVNFDILRHCDVTITVFSTTFPADLSRYNIIFDAMLGTGAIGKPREPFASIIQAINNSMAVVIAVDIPSGLDAETGIPNEPVIKADFTTTFFAEKTGFVNPRAKSVLGNVIILDIGVPNDFTHSIDDY
ncbi:NAD(P)H-hydrate epimerase [Planctomycetales bacterium]|nr:NAD(P)H-hydrate epimerase [Planctomycetales bacterium]